MTISIQYNKTYLQLLSKGLKVRENALPTLVAKESALRLEVKKARTEAQTVEGLLAQKITALSETFRLWGEFPRGLVAVKDVQVRIQKIAGVKIPVLDNVVFIVGEYSRFASAAWFTRGVELLKDIAVFQIRLEIANKKVRTLEFARKKTTQKVNLYEKVQIPEFQDGIRRIKRFLEDEDNLAKSSQKILKARLAAVEAAYNDR